MTMMTKRPDPTAMTDPQTIVEGMTMKDDVRVPLAPGSREPDPQAVPALSGFDPSRSRQVYGDERQMAGVRFVREHDSLTERLFPKWAERRRRRRAMKRYGWDFICCDCGRWVHAEQCARVVAETAWHWHYLCTCGAVNHIWLGSMLAMPDNGKWGGPEAYSSGPYIAGGKA